MDINKTINNIKNSKTFQYGLAAAVFGIIVYSGISLFMGEKNKSLPSNVAKNAIAPIGAQTPNAAALNGGTKNQKRILQEMKIDYEKANNPNDVYLGSQIASNKNAGIIGNYNIKVENKIFQATFNKMKKNSEPAKEKESEKKETQNQQDNQPKMLSLQNTNNLKENNNNTKEDALQLNVLNKITTKDNLEDKIELYSEIYNYSHPLQNNGELVVKDVYWKELSKKSPYYAVNENKTNKADNNSNNIPSDNKNIVKVVPGSTFFARLMIPIENIYAENVKPIAEIVSGPLKGYKIIGEATTDASNSGLILNFTRLISPDGSEYSIQAVGVQTKNLSPKFVDSLNRHLIPRIALATLATLADTFFNQNKGYTAPAQSILSQELQNMIQEYPTEIKVNPKYFVVIFY